MYARKICSFVLITVGLEHYSPSYLWVNILLVRSVLLLQTFTLTMSALFYDPYDPFPPSEVRR